MATKTIQININSKDEASSNINRVSSSLKGLYRGIDTANDGIARFTHNIRSYNNAMYGINYMFVGAFRSATRGIIGFTSDVIKSYSDLEQQHAKTLGAMASDYSKTLDGQKKLIANGEKLKQQAIELSKYGTTGKGSLATPLEISSAQTALFKAGKSANDILNKGSGGKTPVQVVTEFAKGNDLDMDTAVDFAVSLGSQFKVPMDQWSSMLDKVSHAADTSVISVEDIVNSMKYTGGIASGLGRPMEEVLSMLSVMGNAGLRGSMAGTGASAFFTRLLASGTTITDSALEKAPGDAGKKYTKLYADIVDKNGNMADMNEVLTDLDTAMSDMNDEEQTWFARKVFSLFQMKAAYALTGSDNKNLFADTMNDIKNNSGGTNDTKYNFLLDSQYGKIEALKNAWASTKTDIGEKMSPVVQSVADEVLKYLQNNGKYDINTGNIKSAIDKSRDNIASAYGSDIADLIASLADTVVNGGMIAEALLPEAGGLGGAFIKLLNGDIGGAFDTLSDSLNKTNDNIEGLPDDLQDMAKAIKNVIIALTALAAVNTTANVVSSLSTIWGVTGGAMIGGVGLLGRGGASVLAGEGSYALYRGASKLGYSGKSKFYSNGGLDILDALFEDPDNVDKFNGSAEALFNKQLELQRYGGWDTNRVITYEKSNAGVKSSARQQKAKDIYNEIVDAYKKVPDNRRADMQRAVDSKIDSYNKITNLMGLQTQLDNREAGRSKTSPSMLKQYDDVTGKLADKVYTMKGNLTNYERDMLEERLSQSRLAKARKSTISKAQLYNNQDGSIIDKNSNMTWYKNRQKAPTPSNVVDYVSPEDKVDEILNTFRRMSRDGSVDDAMAYFNKSMDELDKVTRDVLDRKIKENEAIAKSTAVENHKTKIIEDQISSQKALVKAQKQATTDVVDIAKKSAERSKKIGSTKPFTGETIVNDASKVDSDVGVLKPNIIYEATENGRVGTTASDDLINAINRTSNDIDSAKTVEGMSDDAKRILEDLSGTVKNLKITVDGIVKNSPTGGSGTSKAINSADDILEIARKMSKGDAKTVMNDFAKKYGLSGGSIFDYVSDSVKGGNNGDGIIDAMQNRSQLTAKYIAKEFGTAEEQKSVASAIEAEVQLAAKEAWNALSTKTKAFRVTGALGKAGVHLSYGLLSGLLQDYAVNEVYKANNNGYTFYDLQDIYSSDKKYDKSGTNARDLALKNSLYGHSVAGNDIVGAIAGGMGSYQAMLKDGFGGYSKPGSYYYNKTTTTDKWGMPVDTPVKSNFVSTYGYIDGLLQSLYTESKNKGNDIPASTMGAMASNMMNAVKEHMKTDGLTEINIDPKQIAYKDVLDSMINNYKKTYTGNNTRNFNSDDPYSQNIDAVMEKVVSGLSDVKPITMKDLLKSVGINKSVPYSTDYLMNEYSKMKNTGNSKASFTLSGFSPIIDVKVQMSSDGKVLGTTTQLHNYNNIIDWMVTQKSKVSSGSNSTNMSN